ncbi:ABC transporter ATP-binding protein [Reyranella sp. CPCC 100927]|uniref:ABC transporter ATP-binding protein n=1 Tax=Reyranella sp. CPCC 100927 TaxID=2599616 RepID=UPI0011B5D4AD|nr:ABC transporter ATP-binding protein [Reyranella sp. CPCC 100927]TWT05619.1 ABC transporter ATP-binding protein [Reyranella sp. CPCC 100927]
MTARLQVRDLVVEYRTRDGVVRAVNGISFDLHRGEILALVGESGCGKSATALAMLRLIPDPPGRIVGGEVLFDGLDLLKADDAQIRAVRGNRIAMIFQEPMTSLNPVHTIGDQVGEPLRLHRRLTRPAAIARSIALLGTVNIPHAEARIGDYPHQFSGGMRQRAMMAMGMACVPDIIVADEPTTALDVTVQAQLLDLLKHQVDTHGTSILLITHNLGVVARYADRVNVIYAGRVVEAASADALYARPTHPYTIGLLRSVPRLDQPATETLAPIEGQPPDPLDLPAGCPFHPRCPLATAQCRREPPPLRAVGDAHHVACWVAAHG